MARLALYLCFAGALLILSGCGQNGADGAHTGTHAPAAQSGPVMPDDPDLASLYTQTCFACHSRNTTGAPVAGNTAQWTARLAKGMDTLVDNTINGIGGMPPLGLCMDCDEADFEALIRFMSGSNK